MMRATRNDVGVAVGSGSRGALALARGGRAVAFLDGRTYVTPDDIRRIALPALRHRVALAPDALLEGRTTMLVVDCGRRMRADDSSRTIGTTHFDQVLNAVMLLTYVALKHGDAVGAMTFGTPAGQERWCSPRKGAHALNAVMVSCTTSNRRPRIPTTSLQRRICCAGHTSVRSSPRNGSAWRLTGWAISNLTTTAPNLTLYT
jgi:AAA lid domain-containing protein